MPQSTITEKFQTTIPLEVRQALNLAPHQRVSYELRPDGSAIIRPVPGLDELYGSLNLQKRVASTREEKHAAREAIAREAGAEGVQ
jgi:bifunctional DNA-binding transcriptional regulator/antitoxin component of YhaV-PrlF toxin-antitoxin module